MPGKIPLTHFGHKYSPIRISFLNEYINDTLQKYVIYSI